MSLILCIETATEICSVGLTEAGRLCCLRESPGAYDHTASLTLLIESCLREAGYELPMLDAVAVSRGPGSYTALRVGTSVAKGICYALDKPLIAVDTLQALALAARQTADGDAPLYCPMIDARRMEVYTALYDAAGRPLSEVAALVVDETAFQVHFSAGQPIVFCGNGAPKCRTVITHPLAVFRSLTCSAAHLAPLAGRALAEGRFENLAYFTPFYLKPPNITRPKKPL